MPSLEEKILSLKKNQNAVILAHNYQIPEVQDIADFVGDSLGLSIEAKKTNADLIVFCGVNFMAETAKILNPSKKVVMPDARAGCPMANMINASDVINLRRQHPKAKVVCYVNTTAEVKAESDICCTSGNAVNVVKSLIDNEIIFIPDQYLGNYVEELTGKKMILLPGFCRTHVKILPEHIAEAKKLHPKALVMCHPECTPAIRKLSSFVASTSKMVAFPESIDAKEFIIATEIGIIHQLEKKYPDKKFYPAFNDILCPNMKLTTLEKVLWCLEDGGDEITIQKGIQERALLAIEKMLTVGA